MNRVLNVGKQGPTPGTAPVIKQVGYAQRKRELIMFASLKKKSGETSTNPE